MAFAARPPAAGTQAYISAMQNTGYASRRSLGGFMENIHGEHTMTNFYSLASSSSGNCSVYLGGGRVILIDAGTNCKYIKESLDKLGLALGDITDILVTHTHADHVSALPVLTKRCRAAVYCTELTLPGLVGRCHHEEIHPVQPGQPFWLGEVRVTPFSTPHDCPGSCGFTFETQDAKLAYCTDLGRVTPEIYRHLQGAHTAFLESNHDVYLLKNGTYPYPLKRRILSDQGHLSNDDAAQTICALARDGLRRAILAHLSDHNNTPELALRESWEALEQAGLAGQVELSAAPKRALGRDAMPGRAAG